MTPPYPTALPILGRRLPGNAEAFRRLLRAVDLQAGERVALVGAADGETARVLARECGAQVTALEWEGPLFAALENRIRTEALAGRVTAKLGDFDQLPPGNFEAVLLETLPPKGELTPFLSRLRGLLGLNGRLALTLPASVGLSTAAPVSAFWTEELGFPFSRPAALMEQLERAGLEPLWAEALSEDQLAEHYRLLEERLASADPTFAERQRLAIDLFRNQGGRRGCSFVMLAGRRREPGEKPPAARTQG